MEHKKRGDGTGRRFPLQRTQYTGPVWLRSLLRDNRLPGEIADGDAPAHRMGADS